MKKDCFTLQKSAEKIMMKNKIERSTPMPKQYITKPIDFSNPRKPAMPMIIDAHIRVNFIRVKIYL